MKQKLLLAAPAIAFAICAPLVIRAVRNQSQGLDLALKNAMDGLQLTL